MVDADRPEFERILRELFGALDKPLTEHQRNAFWRGLQRMSLAELERCRDLLLRDLEAGEPFGRFGVADVWGAKKRLRAAGPQTPPPDPWPGDKWDESANHHLLAHITRTLGENSRCYGRPPSYMGMKTMTTKNADASPEFVRHVQTLVGYKNRWAAQMRALDAGEGVPLEDQRDIWRECMRRAEDEIRSGTTLEMAV